jgi:hypothetical protein
MRFWAWYGIVMGLFGFITVLVTSYCNPIWLECLIGCLSTILVINGILMLKEKKERLHEK